MVAYRALRRAEHDIVPHARHLCRDPSSQVRREVALSLRGIPAERTAGIFVELAKRCDTKDKNSLEAIGLGAAGQESEIWQAIKAGLQLVPGEYFARYQRADYQALVRPFSVKIEQPQTIVPVPAAERWPQI